MLKKITTVFIVFCILGQNSVFATRTQRDEKPLAEVQKQARADADTFWKKYGSHLL